MCEMHTHVAHHILHDPHEHISTSHYMIHIYKPMYIISLFATRKE